MPTLVERVSDLAIAIREKINAIMPRLVPDGGADGQVLTKSGSTPFATEWRSGGSSSTDDINNLTFTWDFLNASTSADIWVGAAISSGTNGATSESQTDSKHPGVALLRSAATVGSGWRYVSGMGVTGSMVITPGCKFACVAATVDIATSSAFVGFLNTTTASRPTHGAFFLLEGNSVSAICVSASVETAQPLTTLVSRAWYTFEIICNQAGSITFNIFNENGTLHATATITSNVTTAKLGNGVVAYTTVATVLNLIYLDLLRLTIKNIGRR